MRVGIVFLALVLCAAASPVAQFANAIKKYAEGGKLQLHKLQATATCDSTAAQNALNDVVAASGVLPCLLTIPSESSYPDCLPATQADFNAFCPTCANAITQAVTIIDGYGCNYDDILAIQPKECTANADCDSGLMCSSAGNCGAWCNMTNPCQSCSQSCDNEICTDAPSNFAGYDNDELAYQGLVMCSKNMSNYCVPLFAGAMGGGGSCQQFADTGCCAPLMLNMVLVCEGLDDGTKAVIQGMMDACPNNNWNQTCGLPAPSSCCGVKICSAGGGGGGGSSSTGMSSTGTGGSAAGLAPALFTFAVIFAKFFY